MGPSIKDVRIKSRNLSPFYPCPKMSASVRTHDKFRKIRFFFLQKMWTSAFEETPLSACPKNVRTGQTTSRRDCERLLWTTSMRYIEKFGLPVASSRPIYFCSHFCCKYITELSYTWAHTLYKNRLLSLWPLALYTHFQKGAFQKQWYEIFY